MWGKAIKEFLSAVTVSHLVPVFWWWWISWLEVLWLSSYSKWFCVTSSESHKRRKPVHQAPSSCVQGTRKVKLHLIFFFPGAHWIFFKFLKYFFFCAETWNLGHRYQGKFMFCWSSSQAESVLRLVYLYSPLSWIDVCFWDIYTPYVYRY